MSHNIISVNSVLVSTRAYVSAKLASSVYYSLSTGEIKDMNIDESQKALDILNDIDDIAPLLPIYYSGENKYKLRGVSLRVTNELKNANKTKQYQKSHIYRDGGYNHFDQDIAHLYVQAVRKQLLDRKDVDCSTLSDFVKEYNLTPAMEKVMYDICAVGQKIPNGLKGCLSSTLGLVFKSEKLKAYLTYATM